MLSVIRNRLSRARNVLAFRDAHPTADPAAALLLEQLDKLYQQGLAEASLATDRDHETRKLSARARDVRRHLQTGLLRLFGRAGQTAAKDVPALASEIVPLPTRASTVGFGTTARLLIDGTKANLDKLTAYGVTADLVAEADALLTEHEDVVSRAVGTRNGRVAAGAQLDVVSTALMEVIGRLDGLFRHRFANRPSDLAAWRNAVTGGGPIHQRAVKPTGSEGGAGPVTPTPGAAAA